MPAPDRRGVFVRVQCPACKAWPTAKFTDELTDHGAVTHVEYVMTQPPAKYPAKLQIRMTRELKDKCKQRGTDWVRETLRKAE